MRQIIPFLLMLGLLPLNLSCAGQGKTQNTPEAKEIQVNRAGIRKTIAAHRRYLSKCYGKALSQKGNENLSGTVLVEFKIAPNGQALQPSVIEERTNLKNQDLHNCLFAGLKSWEFPAHPEGKEIAVRYPFGFHAKPPRGMQQKLDRFEKLRESSSVE